MIEAYEADCLPVLYMAKFVSIPYYHNKSEVGDTSANNVYSVDYHWVNVLGYEIDNIAGKRYLYVASWSEVYVFDYDDIININPDGNMNTLRSVMYYFECEA